MKNIFSLLFVFYSFVLHANSINYLKEIRINTAPDYISIFESSISMSIYENLWTPYLHDLCELYDQNVLNEFELRDVGLRRCNDGSISFVQPKSRGPRGWEGKCGQTAAANSLFHICQKAASPKDYLEKYLKDITPGVLPRTLKRGMKAIFNDNKSSCPQSTSSWQYLKSKSSFSFTKNIEQRLIPNYYHPNLLQINRRGKSYFRNPVMTLIQNPGGKYLHWVTIIDILQDKDYCEFVVNHWDNQYIVPCHIFAKWSKDVGSTYPIILQSYSSVSFN